MNGGERGCPPRGFVALAAIDAGLTAAEWRLYVLLSCHANHRRRAWPRGETLAEELDVSRWRVRQLLEALERADLIRRERRRHATDSQTYLVAPYPAEMPVGGAGARSDTNGSTTAPDPANGLAEPEHAVRQRVGGNPSWPLPLTETREQRQENRSLKARRHHSSANDDAAEADESIEDDDLTAVVVSPTRDPGRRSGAEEDDVGAIVGGGARLLHPEPPSRDEQLAAMRERLAAAGIDWRAPRDA